MLSVLKLANSAVHRFSALEVFPQPRVIALRHPVLFMHGFGVLGTLRRGGHLHAEAMHLRQHGVIAYAPNVAPYSTVRARTPWWQRRIEQVLAETRAEKLNIIAHSMGALDARYLISCMGMHEVVASLTTVSAPHRGTSVAAITMDKPVVVRQAITDLCNWIGRNAIDECDPDFETAVHELTPEFVQYEFNPQVPDHPDVRYWSYAGRAGRGTKVPINPMLIYQNNVLYAREGENDGFVSVNSARWGTFLGTFDADHARSVGLNLSLGGSFNSNAFYLGVVEMLEREGL